MWGVAVMLGATVLSFVVFALWQSRVLIGGRRRCNVCGGERLVLPSPEVPRTYEVLACPECMDVITAAHGQPSRFATCPSCSQFGLEVEVTVAGLVEVGDVPPVDVEAECRICGYREEWSSPDRTDELPNNVIEFPRR